MGCPWRASHGHHGILVRTAKADEPPEACPRHDKVARHAAEGRRGSGERWPEDFCQGDPRASARACGETLGISIDDFACRSGGVVGNLAFSQKKKMRDRGMSGHMQCDV